jgi:hypothetical protein
MMRGGLRVRVEEAVTAFDEDEWDGILDPDDLQATHRFVRACQASGVEGATYAHVLVEDALGPAGLASLSAFPVALDLLAPPWTRGASRLVRRWAPGFLRFPFVMGGLPVSFNQSCLRVRAGVDPPAVLRLLTPVAEELAARVEASILCFKEFSPEELPVAAGLEELGYTRAQSLPSCLLPLPYRSFPEYMGAMRAGYRRQLRASAAPAEQAGLTLRLEELAPHVGRVFPLYQQVMDRAEFQLERLNEAFFRALASEMPEETRVLLLEGKGGELLAAAVLLRGPRRTTFLITGIDYRRSREVRGYERLVTAVVAQAIRWGARSLEMGQTSWELKRRLGARLSPRFLYLRHRKPLGNRVLRRALPYLFPQHAFSQRRVFRSGEGA